MLYWHGCPRCTHFFRTGTYLWILTYWHDWDMLAKIFKKFVCDVEKLPGNA
jgi:hypothetical protein